MDRYKRLLHATMSAMRGGDFPGAARAAVDAVGLRPDLGLGWRVLGEALLGAGDLAGAEESLRRSVKLEPYTAAAHATLGRVLQAMGRVEEPLRCFMEALRLAPADPNVLTQAGHFLLEQGQLDEAEGCFRAALARRASPGAVAGLVGVLERHGAVGSAAEALDHYQQLIPGSSQLTLAAARVWRRQGRAAEAVPLVEAALAGRPSRETRSLLLHALAALRDALGETDAAFAAWHRANALRGLRFDADSFNARVDALIARWSPRALADAPRASTPTERPVLIVGMPRSGTSLVEQILASHSQVHGAGELDHLPNLAADLPTPLTVEALDAAARSYQERLPRSTQAARVTDKLPHNFLWLGEIGRMLPGARVIHCRRDPVDTCFSCFRQNFHATHDYAASLEDLGAYWRAYDRLMAHWRAASPMPMLEVDYEQLVADPEGTSRSMAAFVGLDWEPAMLCSHESGRTVNTASYAQVRRPIYRSSVGRAHAYAAHLGPLRAALGHQDVSAA